MTTSQLVTVVYAAVLHIASLAALTVLTAMKVVPVETGLPLIGGLLGLGAGVSLSLPGTTGATTSAPAPGTVPAQPAG